MSSSIAQYTPRDDLCTRSCKFTQNEFVVAGGAFTLAAISYVALKALGYGNVATAAVSGTLAGVGIVAATAALASSAVIVGVFGIVIYALLHRS
jgi:hypothetical protein